MFKKVIIVSFITFLLIGNHGFAPSKHTSLINVNYIIQPFHQINVAFAAEQEQQISKSHTDSWTFYLLPGGVGIIFTLGIAFYWLIYRKKQLKSESSGKKINH